MSEFFDKLYKSVLQADEIIKADGAPLSDAQLSPERSPRRSAKCGIWRAY